MWHNRFVVPRFILSYLFLVILTCLPACRFGIHRSALLPMTLGVMQVADTNTMLPVLQAVQNYAIADDPLSSLLAVFVLPNAFTCGLGDTPDVMCVGLTETGDYLDGSVITLAMLRPGLPDDSTAWTDDFACTALAHELFHVLLYEETGDGDAAHATPWVWDDAGAVNAVGQQLCPDNPLVHHRPPWTNVAYVPQRKLPAIF